MSKARTFEFWAIDKNGVKWNEYIESSSVRNSKIKALITAKFGIEIDKCKDFGMRQIFD